MKLYCIKIYKLDRFDIESEILYSYSKYITDLFLERFINDTSPKYATFDLSKYSIEYFETDDKQQINTLLERPDNCIHIYSNRDKTKNVVLTEGQYKSALMGGSVINNYKDILVEKIHFSSVRFGMITLRYGKSTDIFDYIYRLVKHDFSEVDIDGVEYMLNTKSYLKKYEI